MKRLLALVALMVLLAPLVCAEDPNESNESNESLKDQIAEAAGGLKDTGDETLDSITQFLADASPFILIALAILIFVLSSMGKWIAIILVILAVAKIAWSLLG